MNEDQPYNGMFKICETKCRFLLADGTSIKGFAVKDRHKYDLPDENVYSEDGSRILRPATQTENNTNFLIKMHRMHILDVKPFLNHHFQNTPDKENFLDYLEHGILPSTGMNVGVKDLGLKWVNEQRTTAIKYPTPVKAFMELVKEILEQHLSTVDGFLAFKYASIPQDHTSQNYWLFELHKHLFWALSSPIEIQKETLLKRAHKWVSDKHFAVIIEFNKRANSLPAKAEHPSLNIDTPKEFVSVHAYKLFLAWHDEFKEQNTQVADYSFIIKKMINDKLILEVKSAAYLELLQAHGISISRLKTLNDCSTAEKESLYTRLKQSVFDMH
jgi:hypothetical protein